MTPTECKTVKSARVAAGAVFEARLFAARVAGIRTQLGLDIDKALYDLEHAFWKRADTLAQAKKKATKR